MSANKAVAVYKGVVQDVVICNSSDIHLGNEVQYDGPVEVQQIVSGLPGDLAAKPEVGHGLAKIGLIAAATNSTLTAPSMTLRLLSSNDNKSIPQHKMLVWWSAGCLILVVLIVLICTLSLLLTSLPSSEPSRIILPPDSEATYNPFKYGSGSNVTLSGKLRIISREDWLAQPTHLLNVSKNAHYIIITETNGDPCDNEAECKLQVNLSQQKDLVNKLTDVAPTFFLAGDGYAYEGRGWGVTNQCSFIPEFDIDSICIAFIGSFSTEIPSNKQLLAAKQLIDMGISNGQIVKNYIIYGLKQVNSKFKFPAQELFNLIQEWPNWRADIIL